MSKESDIEKATELQNEWWSDTEWEVINKFKNMDIVEEDCIWCETCNGYGKIDWVSNIMKAA